MIKPYTILQSYNPTITRDVVQSGRTLALGARGRWFESSHLDYTSLYHFIKVNSEVDNCPTIWHSKIFFTLSITNEYN